MTWKHSCHKTRYTSSKWILWVHEILKNTQFIELRNYLSKHMGEAQLSLCRLVNSTEHFTTRVVHTTDSTYLQIMCFKHCSWISYSQLQPIIKQSLSPSFRNAICHGFMVSGADRKTLASEDVLPGGRWSFSWDKKTRCKMSDCPIFVIIRCV